MDLIGSSLGAAVVGAAATILALSLLVQVLQELWKFLFSTRSALYVRVLQEYLGPLGKRLAEPGVLSDFLVRGPFQFRQLRATGNLEPLATPQLVEGLERTAAPWVREALRRLRLEVSLQAAGETKPSPDWKRFVTELTTADAGGKGASDAHDVATFLAEYNLGGKKMPARMNASTALIAFRERFLPHVVDAEKHANRLREMFDCQYKRRNQLITFVLGFLVAFALNQPTQRIVTRAQAMSPEEATALADNVLQLYERTQAADTTRDTTAARPPLPQLDSTLSRLVGTLDSLARRGTAPDAANAALPIPGITEFFKKETKKIWYLLGCLLTAVLVSFGAPFWNDLVGALANKNRSAPRPRPTAEPAPAVETSDAA
jgi:hypothetical protein